MTREHLYVLAWIIVVSGTTAMVLQGFLLGRALKSRSAAKPQQGTVENIASRGEIIECSGMFLVGILSFILGLMWGWSVYEIPLAPRQIVDLDVDTSISVWLSILRNLTLTGLAIHGIVYWVQLRRVITANLSR